MSADEIEAAAAGLAGWTSTGTHLQKRWKFADFASALGWVNRIGALAEAADHHPDLRLGWGYVEAELTTHDRGGITDVDIDLASKIDALETTFGQG
jgi:4a-hydroxytetrahydrobiopterin dehydratase